MCHGCCTLSVGLLSGFAFLQCISILAPAFPSQLFPPSLRIIPQLICSRAALCPDPCCTLWDCGSSRRVLLSPGLTPTLSVLSKVVCQPCEGQSRSLPLSISTRLCRPPSELAQTSRAQREPAILAGQK